MLVQLITSDDPAVRDQSLSLACRELSDTQLIDACEELDAFWRKTENLYERVRALFFLYAIHRFILPERGMTERFGRISFDGYADLLNRRFREAIEAFKAEDPDPRCNDTLASGLARAYYRLALQFLADQVRQSVRSLPGNQWMFRTGHAADYPLRLRPELLGNPKGERQGAFPVLREQTAVRMDLSHSSWSDIFFLGMDRPEFAKVINVSIDLALRGAPGGPQPPVEAWLRVIDQPVIRLVSIDLECEAEVDSLAELFDFGRDYLGLLKAAVIAAGIIPPGVEGSPQHLSAFLERLVGEGNGLELVSSVNNIPKGSRLAVSTNLLASLISVCMRASRQIPNLEGPLDESSRRIVAARAILGEWLGGSGGGWQDSGGVWPGIKLIEGCLAEPGDAEHGISRGRLLPKHTVFGRDVIPDASRQALQDSLVLVHGGMAQNVGPILEMVSERYLLRSEKEWVSRRESLDTTFEILEALKAGDMRELGRLTTGHFFGPLKEIIPWASTAFTEDLIASVRDKLGDAFWGFWMLGGMSGGGMGFIIDPTRREEAKDVIHELLLQLKRRYASALPFAMDPVVYDFSINENGSTAAFVEQGMPSAYYRLRIPHLLRRKPSELLAHERGDLSVISARVARTVEGETSKEKREPELSTSHSSLLTSHSLPSPEDLSILTALLPKPDTDDRAGQSARSLNTLLEENGFDPEQHEWIRRQLLAGKLGLAQNRLSTAVRLEDARADELVSHRSRGGMVELGRKAIANGEVAVVSLAAGAGSRWSGGAGIVKALHPFCEMDGKHRNFIELHLRKSAVVAQAHDTRIPHVITTGYLTHEAIASWLEAAGVNSNAVPVALSRGQSVGLRFVPTVRDLIFAWEEMPQEQLDEQAQKMRASVRRALLEWARSAGEGSDYRDNLPMQCMHPVGHWYEVPNMLLNGTLAKLLSDQPELNYLLIHNIDTLGASVDPELLGLHLASGNALTFEIISRRIDDHGGGLAKVDGRLRLVEGLAMPTEADEFRLTYYNTATNWVSIDPLLEAFGLSRSQLNDTAVVRTAVRRMANRMPTYLTIKEVKKRWGRGQEDVFPVLQFERLWGDMSAQPDLPCGFAHVTRFRGQQLKEQAQLDAWLRDGSREALAKLGQLNRCP